MTTPISTEGPPIEFWFDFSSPYAYFAAHQIEPLAARHGRAVLWRPFLLGAMLKLTGMAPLIEQPVRGDYGRHDWARLSRLHDLPFRLPDRFPILSVAPARAYYAVEATAPAIAPQFALDLFRALFGKGIDITDPERIGEIGAALGLDRAWLAAAARDPQWKEALRLRTDEAIAKGVFGAPFVRVGEEGFWGSDRLWMVERWLETGGW